MRSQADNKQAPDNLQAHLGFAPLPFLFYNRSSSARPPLAGLKPLRGCQGQIWPFQIGWGLLLPVAALFFRGCVFFLVLLFIIVYITCGGWLFSLFFFWGCAVFSLPSVSSVSAAGCRLGASGFSVRPSSRGLGGFVAAVGFRSSSSASLLAARLGSCLPACCGGCVVRFLGGLFWVSVPVLPASVPAVVRSSGGPLVVVGSPPAVRSAVVGGGLWSVWPSPFPAPPGRGSAFPAPPVRPAPGSRRLRVAAFFAGQLPAPSPRLPVFGSRVLARAWAVACGSSPFCSPSPCGGWVSASGPAVAPSCLFCGLLGACASLRPGAGCGFRPWLSLPGWPAGVPAPSVSSVPLFPLSSAPAAPVPRQLSLF